MQEETKARKNIVKVSRIFLKAMNTTVNRRGVYSTSENDPEEDKEAYLSQIPAGRWGTPADVGEAVAYFASEEAGFITGQTLCVNGGNSPW